MRFIRPRVQTRVANGVILANGDQATRVDQDIAWLDPDVPQDNAPPSTTLRKPKDIPTAVLSGTARLVEVPYVRYTGSSLHDAKTEIFRDIPTIIPTTSYPVVAPGNAEFTDVQLAALNQQPVFFAEINGHRLILLHVNVANLGGSTDFRFLIEFEDPDFPGNWIPSKETAPGTPSRQDITTSTNEWTATLGSYIFQSREEHRHFRRFRVRCRHTGTAPTAAARVDIAYAHDGGRATVPEQ